MSLIETKSGKLQLGTFRKAIIWGVIASLFAYLIGHLFYMQVYAPDRLIQEGNNRVVRHYSYEPPRGYIVDRNGKILALSIPVKEVNADPKKLHESGVYRDKGAMNQLASLLDIDVNVLYKKTQNPKKRFVNLKHYLEFDKASSVKAICPEGLILVDTYKRYYPTGKVNAPLVGILNGEGTGIYGVEQSFNAYLSSHAQLDKANKDRYNHIVENLGTVQKGNQGGNLILSVDQRLQDLAYQKLEEAVKSNEADSGCAVLVDVKTGEVLAMVTSPSFDPNDRTHFDSNNAKNRTITDTFEPGSTLKPIVALAALEAKATSWNEVFDTRPFIVDGKTVRDSHAMQSGTLKDIIQYSSNTGMARLSMRIGPHKVLKMVENFGFGHKSGTYLVGESAGRLNANRSFWSKIDEATLGFGYGISVTTAQLASAYATLASGGYRRPISVLKTLKPQEGSQIVNHRQIKYMMNALETVVSEGTGGKAAIERYRVAGKTGTAKIAKSGGYSNEYVSTFAGFAPISDPRFALVVVISAPKAGQFYGGVVSGPVFRDVMSHALQIYNIKPDRQIENSQQ